jgi:hypothetical protein
MQSRPERAGFCLESRTERPRMLREGPDRRYYAQENLGGQLLTRLCLWDDAGIVRLRVGPIWARR